MHYAEEQELAVFHLLSDSYKEYSPVAEMPRNSTKAPKQDKPTSSMDDVAGVPLVCHETEAASSCVDIFKWHLEHGRTTRPVGKNLCMISKVKADQVNKVLFGGNQRIRGGDSWCISCRRIALERMKKGMAEDEAAVAVADRSYLKDAEALDTHIQSLCDLLKIGTKYTLPAQSGSSRNKYRAKILRQLASVLHGTKPK